MTNGSSAFNHRLVSSVFDTVPGAQDQDGVSWKEKDKEQHTDQPLFWLNRVYLNTKEIFYLKHSIKFHESLQQI